MALVECSGCGRKFNEKALARHSKACAKVFQDKRKPMDMASQRVGGTDAAKYYRPDPSDAAKPSAIKQVGEPTLPFPDKSMLNRCIEASDIATNPCHNFCTSQQTSSLNSFSWPLGYVLFLLLLPSQKYQGLPPLDSVGRTPWSASSPPEAVQPLTGSRPPALTVPQTT